MSSIRFMTPPFQVGGSEPSIPCGGVDPYNQLPHPIEMVKKATQIGRGLLALVATVPTIAAMIGEQKERQRGEAGTGAAARTVPFRAIGSPRAGWANRDSRVVNTAPDAPFSNEPAV
jgi:hypothetical protein